MRHYRLVLLVVVALAQAGCHKVDDLSDNAPGWELKPPPPDASPVTSKKQLPGFYPARSRIKDRAALGGFGRCGNYPKDLGEKDWGTNGAVSIVAFPNEKVAHFKQLGFALRVVNRTAEQVSFAACDSCLTIVSEAMDSNGTWRPIELPPDPICGNSFHRVFLRPGQYWEFPAPLYDGPMKTKLRFQLDPGNGRPVVYSNEVGGQITVSQFSGNK